MIRVYVLSSRLTVGLVQASFDISPVNNAEKASLIIKKNYREADLIILPEYSMTNPLILGDSGRVYEISEFITNSRYLSYFIKLANELGTNIVTHLVEKTDRPPLTKSSTILITNRGEVLPVYNKIHLFDAYGYRESSFFEQGKSPSKIISLNNFQIAFAICYDIRFPELFRSYAKSGVNTTIVQAGWIRGPLKEEILDKIASTRAHENTMFIIVVNQVGEMFTGRSGVFNPWGYREVDLGVEERYFEHVLRIEDVEEVRKTLPVVRQAIDKWEIEIKS